MQALCQRIGILVKGELKCLGSSQHLKTRFGRGFQIQLNVGSTADESSAHELMKRMFDKVDLIESYLGSMKFQCEKAGLTFGQIFTALEANRASTGIVDYAVSQMTLEQIFIAFARGDVEVTPDAVPSAAVDAGVKIKIEGKDEVPGSVNHSAGSGSAD